MSRGPTHRVVVEAFPVPGADAFEDFVCAAVACWVHPARSTVEVDAHVRQKLADIGWQVIRVEDRREVHARTELSEELERERFDQAQLDGFVAQVHRVPRSVVGSNDGPDDLVRAFRAFSRDMLRGAFSLFSEKDDQWANAVIDEENEFLPLWSSRDAAAAWLDDFPGYRVRPISHGELVSGFLEDIHAAGLLVGLGLEPGALVTFHPAALAAALATSSGPAIA